MRQDADGQPARPHRAIDEAILRTVAYADLFDYPLTVQEIHRYLTGQAASLSQVEECLARHAWLRDRLGSASPYWFLADRAGLVQLRQQRASYAQRLWPWAVRCGRLIASLPFVRMVAVSGSLTMDNVRDTHDDIDFLIVVRRGRVWSARGAVVLLERLTRHWGVHLCPNYVLAEHQLKIEEENLFTAHELAQLVPLHGLGVYDRLMVSNAWRTRFLPNAGPRQADWGRIGWVQRSGKRAMEFVLNGHLGDIVERWERERKIPRLRREMEEAGGTEARFGPDVCKGHKHSHATQVGQQYTARLQSLGIEG
jgi:hypothetical protein